MLESRILDDTFPSGTRLPREVDLGEQFGVSRTVVRDALRVLEARGLIDIRQGRGTTIRPVTSEAYAEAVAMLIVRSDLTIGDLMDARATLDAQLVRVAAENRLDGDLRRIGAAFDAFRASAETRDADGIVRNHVAFHTELLRATRLAALNVLLGPIQLMMIATSLAPAGLDQGDPSGWQIDAHRGLLEAVTSGDKDEVEAAIEVHWATSRSPAYREIRKRRVAHYYPSPRMLLRQSRLLDGVEELAGNSARVGEILDLESDSHRGRQAHSAAEEADEA